MPLTERQEQIVTVLADGQFQVRTDTIIERDGVEISRLHARYVLDPAQSDVQTESPRIQALASAVWTPAVKAARAAVLARNRAAFP